MPSHVLLAQVVPGTKDPTTAVLRDAVTGPGAGSPIDEADTAGLPASIAADLLEAAACCSFGAYRAAGLLARRAVEQAAVMRRVPLDRKTLGQKLGWLLDAGHLPAAYVGDARTVTSVGTAAAHGGDALHRPEAWAAVRSALAVTAAVLGTGG
jgi:hypothetical protein